MPDDMEALYAERLKREVVPSVREFLPLARLLRAVGPAAVARLLLFPGTRHIVRSLASGPLEELKGEFRVETPRTRRCQQRPA